MKGRSRRVRDGAPDRSPSAEEWHDDPEAAARALCLRLLTHAPRTRAQLEAELSRRDVPPEVTERVLGRFAEVGIVDDAAFADAWVQSRHHGRGLSRRALATELARRGVADQTVHEAVDGIEPSQEIDTARELIARRLASTAGNPPAVRFRRLAGVLARKGYPAGLAFRLVREALEAEGVQGEDIPDPEPDGDV